VFRQVFSHLQKQLKELLPCPLYKAMQIKAEGKANLLLSKKNSLKLSYSPFLLSNIVTYFLQIVSSRLQQIVSFYYNISINSIEFSILSHLVSKPVGTIFDYAFVNYVYLSTCIESLGGA